MYMQVEYSMLIRNLRLAFSLRYVVVQAATGHFCCAAPNPQIAEFFKCYHHALEISRNTRGNAATIASIGEDEGGAL